VPLLQPQRVVVAPHPRPAESKRGFVTVTLFPWPTGWESYRLATVFTATGNPPYSIPPYSPSDGLNPLIDLCRPYVAGLSTLPRDGRFLLVGNHTQSGAEVFLISYYLRRELGARVRPLAERPSRAFFIELIIGADQHRPQGGTRASQVNELRNDRGSGRTLPTGPASTAPLVARCACLRESWSPLPHRWRRSGHAPCLRSLGSAEGTDEFRCGRADVVRAVFLDEMRSVDCDLGLVGPFSDVLASPPGQK